MARIVCFWGVSVRPFPHGVLIRANSVRNLGILREHSSLRSPPPFAILGAKSDDRVHQRRVRHTVFGKGLSKYRDFGILLLRLGLGVMFIWAHGAPKLFGGPAVWEKVGAAMSLVGVEFAQGFWGLMAGSAEFFGGAFLIAGLLVRPVSLLLAFVMLIATLSVYTAQGTLIGSASHPLELGITFVALFVIGAGKYSLDQRLGLN